MTANLSSKGIIAALAAIQQTNENLALLAAHFGLTPTRGRARLNRFRFKTTFNAHDTKVYHNAQTGRLSVENNVQKRCAAIVSYFSASGVASGIPSILFALRQKHTSYKRTDVLYAVARLEEFGVLVRSAHVPYMYRLAPNGVAIWAIVKADKRNWTRGRKPLAA